MSTSPLPKEAEKRKRDEGFSPYKKLAAKKLEVTENEEKIPEKVHEKEVEESAPKRKELRPILVNNIAEPITVGPVVLTEFVSDIKIDQISRQGKGRKSAFAYHVIEKKNGNVIQREFSERTVAEMSYQWNQDGFQLYRTNMVNVSFHVKKAGVYRLSLIRCGGGNNNESSKGKIEFVPLFIQGLGEKNTPVDYCCVYIVRPSQKNGQVEFNFHLRRSHSKMIGDTIIFDAKSKYTRFHPELRKHQLALWHHSDLNKPFSDDLKDWTFLSMSGTFEIFSQPKSVKVYSSIN